MGAACPSSAFPSCVGTRKVPHQLPRACQEFVCQRPLPFSLSKLAC